MRRFAAPGAGLGRPRKAPRPGRRPSRRSCPAGYVSRPRTETHSRWKRRIQEVISVIPCPSRTSRPSSPPPPNRVLYRSRASRRSYVVVHQSRIHLCEVSMLNRYAAITEFCQWTAFWYWSQFASVPPSGIAENSELAPSLRRFQHGGPECGPFLLPRFFLLAEEEEFPMSAVWGAR